MAALYTETRIVWVAARGSISCGVQPLSWEITSREIFKETKLKESETRSATIDYAERTNYDIKLRDANVTKNMDGVVIVDRIRLSSKTRVEEVPVASDAAPGCVVEPSISPDLRGRRGIRGR